MIIGPTLPRQVGPFPMSFPTSSRLTYGSDITSSPDRRVSCLEMDAGKKNANRWIGADVVGAVSPDQSVGVYKRHIILEILNCSARYSSAS